MTAEKKITLSTSYTRLEAFQLFGKLVANGISREQVCSEWYTLDEESQIVRLARFIGFDIWLDAQVEYYKVADEIVKEAQANEAKAETGKAETVLEKVHEEAEKKMSQEA